MGKVVTDMSAVTIVGLDLAKHVFQVHAINAAGRVIVAKALKRKDVLAFFWRSSRVCLAALSGLRLLVQPINGRAS